MPDPTPPLEPLLTVVVPAYGAEGHLHRALDSLLSCPGQLEVVVVDDGSLDGTGAIADAYAATRPDLFRVIHQANAGHGGAINTGIDQARGKYLKVLDADDWLDAPVLREVMDLLADLDERGGVDAVMTDYVHERQGKSSRKARFDGVFPTGRIFGWEHTSGFGTRQYLLMHAIIYRTALLREVGLRLPEHTFYVDSLYVVTPLTAVRRMYYLPRPLYHYLIGREGQSVQADVMSDASTSSCESTGWPWTSSRRPGTSPTGRCPPSCTRRCCTTCRGSARCPSRPSPEAGHRTTCSSAMPSVRSCAPAPPSCTVGCGAAWWEWAAPCRDTPDAR